MSNIRQDICSDGATQQTIKRASGAPAWPNNMKTVKTALRISAGLLWVISFITLVFCFIYSPEYIYRCIISRVMGIEVTQVHIINAASTPYQFKAGTFADENVVRKIFEQVIPTKDFDGYLQSTDTSAFIVLRDGTLLYEHYFNGYQRDSLIPSHSVTKSIVSALVGIAISDGVISSVDDPITSYIPELIPRDPRFSAIKIRHLLMMTSGIRFTNYFFFTSDSAIAGTYPDNRYALLHFPKIIESPGKYFLYNDYNPQLLGLILERSIDMPVSDYLKARIWQPLGMEYDAAWVVDSREFDFERMQGGFKARAIDFAKFARLILLHGIWNRKIIIPELWVDESTQEFKSSGGSDLYPENNTSIPDGMFYQYMWWGLHSESGKNDYFSMGKYGQMIYISPSTNLVVLRFGERGSISDFEKWYSIAHDFINRYTLEKR